MHVEAASPLSKRPGRTVRLLCEDALVDATWSRYEGGQPGPDLHVHHEHVDAFYIVEGELQFRVGPEGRIVRAPAGTFVLVPPEVAHGFDNASGDVARWLNFHAPSTGFVAYLRGDRPRFDSDDPPPGGGLPFERATVVAPGAVGTIGESAQLVVRTAVLEPGQRIAQSGEGVSALFVLEGEVGVNGARYAEHAWLTSFARLTAQNAGPGPARLLLLDAPA